MKRVCISVVLGLVAVAFSVQSASALPPFNKEWLAKYVEGNTNTKFVEAVGTTKCNVCHAGKSKKEHNEYGLVVRKYLTKAKVNEIKDKHGDDRAAADAETKKYISDGLAKAEAEKNGSGKTYGEMLKAGELPGGAAE
jgi:hypothetical protein